MAHLQRALPTGPQHPTGVLDIAQDRRPVREVLQGDIGEDVINRVVGDGVQVGTRASTHATLSRSARLAWPCRSISSDTNRAFHRVFRNARGPSPEQSTTGSGQPWQCSCQVFAVAA
jgi:hypothetical protein